MQPWVWLILIIVIILVVWWLMSRSAKTYEADFDVSHEAESHTEITAESVPTEPDDLASLEGIGPKVKEILQKDGITTFAQLAAAEPSQLNEILEANELQFMDPTSWPEQAKLAAQGKNEELQALQERLKGGRKAE